MEFVDDNAEQRRVPSKIIRTAVELYPIVAWALLLTWRLDIHPLIFENSSQLSTRQAVRYSDGKAVDEVVDRVELAQQLWLRSSQTCDQNVVPLDEELLVVTNNRHDRVLLIPSLLYDGDGLLRTSRRLPPGQHLVGDRLL